MARVAAASPRVSPRARATTVNFKPSPVRRPSSAGKASPKAPAARGWTLPSYTTTPAPNSALAPLTLPLSYEEGARATHGPSTLLVGLDEAGRGPLAGPVVAGAVAVLGGVHPVSGVTDSKAVVSEADREALYDALVASPGVVWGVGVVDVAEIDRINILQASMLAMEMALEECQKKLAGMGRPPTAPTCVAVDGPFVPARVHAAVGPGGKTPVPTAAPPVLSKLTSAEAVIKGDGKVYSIAASSIIAKVTRDRIMHGLHALHPEFDFASHKGYGVPAHLAALAKYPFTVHHRKTFAPVKHMVAGGAVAGVKGKGGKNRG